MTTSPLRDDIPSPDMLVGTRVHMLMWERGMTQVALAPLLGITQTGLSKKLKGRVGWSVSDLLAVARELGTSVAYLVGETENRRPDDPNGGSWLVRPPGLEPGTH
ncbi:helix-turn-helix domain-containing protein [Brevibacterium sp. K72]|uniref:helix-turn-helix domain-containing protein n=1 Tax=Brevibacterium sp. K72 TaxID=3390729 RepID=UPI003D2FF073